MDALLIEGLVCMRQFPPVVHPRHAREALASGDAAAWCGGYAITVPEHRQLLEDLLGSLAWRATGQAVLLTGLYGTGKSHLLVLLHLLTALPSAWTTFLEAHPAFRRYATPAQGHRRLVVHFSLDEYGPGQALEEAVTREIARVLPSWSAHGSRYDAWSDLQTALTAAGYDGLLLLLDEVSLFLAGRTPAHREADAAFLQFLAGWTARAPVWVIGTLQRTLGDVGALRSHSWRQVEDRFHRYTLTPQEIDHVLRDKLFTRTDPAAIRALIAERIAPAAVAHGIDITAGDFQTHWPCHPHAIGLLLRVVNNHLSPHRSAMEVFQRLGTTGWLARPATRLITVTDLFGLLVDDLQAQPALERLWRGVTLLEHCAARTADPALARHAVQLLALLCLADATATVEQLRAFLFDGETAPTVTALSTVLHQIRRQAPYLTVTRDAMPEQELFSLALDDEVGALAHARMQEMARECPPDDPRVIEAAVQACPDLARALPDAARLTVPWYDSDRAVSVQLCRELTADSIARLWQGGQAGQADAAVLLGWPGTDGRAIWQTTTATLTGASRAVVLYWHPRALTPDATALWAEYAAWERAAAQPTATAQRERRVTARCRERAEELRPAVAASVLRLYREGRWIAADGQEGAPADGTSLEQMLGAMLAPGFAQAFPAFPLLAPQGVPTRTSAQQLLAQFIAPGAASIAPQSLLGEYLERYLTPLGCVAWDGTTARLTPPRWEVTEPLLAAVAAGPRRVPEAQAALQRPPLGLVAEQSRLVIAAAVKCGAVQGLDAFLQPLDPAAVDLARSDALVFLAPPAEIEPRYHPLIRQFAARWAIADAPWPIACSQVLRAIRHAAQTWGPRQPEMRALLADWAEAFHVLPWDWQHTERALAAAERLQTAEPLPILADAPDLLEKLEAAWDGLSWWRTHGDLLRRLATTPLPGSLQAGWEEVATALQHGEGCFADLPRLDERLTGVLEAYGAAYASWHAATFGPEVVHALRAAFDLPAFRAVKLLARCPLPLPPGAERCLDALAQAREHYCPGHLLRVDLEGVCSKCRLPLGAPSPLPEAPAVTAWATDALREYTELLRGHPWAAEVRARLTRAPEAIARRGQALLAWDGAADTLLALLDEPLLAWLCRERTVTGTRQVSEFSQRLRGHDLTLEETRQALQAWIDPDGTLDGDALLAFE